MMFHYPRVCHLLNLYSWSVLSFSLSLFHFQSLLSYSSFQIYLFHNSFFDLITLFLIIAYLTLSLSLSLTYSFLLSPLYFLSQISLLFTCPTFFHLVPHRRRRRLHLLLCRAAALLRCSLFTAKQNVKSSSAFQFRTRRTPPETNLMWVRKTNVNFCIKTFTPSSDLRKWKILRLTKDFSLRLLRLMFSTNLMQTDVNFGGNFKFSFHLNAHKLFIKGSWSWWWWSSPFTLMIWIWIPLKSTIFL